MQEYCINRDDLDFLIDVTKFKTKADWNEDPMKDIPPGVKSSFTRTFNTSGMRAKCNIMVEAFRKAKGRKAAAPAGDNQPMGELPYFT
ncbi:hypothetical protein WJX84_009648 [Apatococcus fuscideae]|uniref:DNA replication factor RFC1 C-terminal domain-containing protein n=1 Tax=Apatococcus fuscideae TaxID=2026836 RepID=A0AAW1T2D9_9CHLO